MFSTRRKLHQKGVLGINRRNGRYIQLYNSRHNFPLVDDKVLTKRLAIEAGVAVPELIAVIEFPGQVKQLETLLADHQDFVIKPARGSGGEGIVVISGRPKGQFRKINGLLMTAEQVRHHVFNVLSGLYSLAGLPDRALIETRVNFDPTFEQVSYQGVPDVRIIVFQGVPVMSMIRLPTRMSDGKANLHQGAIGVGVDIATGRTLKAVWRNEVIEEHPDTGNSIVGLTIPHWDTMLRLAARSYQLTQLGYQGVDLVLDKNLGPLLLEINARPGLNIQIANGAGLERRLQAVEQAIAELVTEEQRVEFAKQSFGVN